MSDATNKLEDLAERAVKVADKAKDAAHIDVAAAASAMEETFETLERIPKADLNGTNKKQQYIILGVTAVVSAAVGGAVAYSILKKKMRLKYEAIAEEEIADAKKFYSKMHKKDEFSDPISALEALASEENVDEEVESKLDELAYRSPLESPYSAPKKTASSIVQPVADDDEDVEEQEDPNETVVYHTLLRDDDGKVTTEKVTETTRNIFDEPGQTSDFFDLEEEMKTRTSERPYVLSQDEYYDGDEGYNQVTLVYFEGDGVLVDEKDAPIREIEETVGTVNVNRFGYGSEDRNTIHIRNERLMTDFEVTRSTGSYTADVLNIIEHSDEEYRGGIRKFRSDRE